MSTENLDTYVNTFANGTKHDTRAMNQTAGANHIETDHITGTGVHHKQDIHGYPVADHGTTIGTIAPTPAYGAAVGTIAPTADHGTAIGTLAPAPGHGTAVGTTMNNIDNQPHEHHGGTTIHNQPGTAVHANQAAAHGLRGDAAENLAEHTHTGTAVHSQARKVEHAEKADKEGHKKEMNKNIAKDPAQPTGERIKAAVKVPGDKAKEAKEDAKAGAHGGNQGVVAGHHAAGHPVGTSAHDAPIVGAAATPYVGVDRHQHLAPGDANYTTSREPTTAAFVHGTEPALVGKHLNTDTAGIHQPATAYGTKVGHAGNTAAAAEAVGDHTPYGTTMHNKAREVEHNQKAHHEGNKIADKKAIIHDKNESTGEKIKAAVTIPADALKQGVHKVAEYVHEGR